MYKDLKEKFAFTLGATHVGISHNIGGAFHRFVESFTHVGIFHITRRVGFTLAEVLITLGIIGIVSAMTIPTLVKNYHKKVLKNQFKNAYSIVQQAWMMTKADLGVSSVYKIYTVRDASGAFIKKDEFVNTFNSKLRTAEVFDSNNDLPDYHIYSSKSIKYEGTPNGFFLNKPKFMRANGILLSASISYIGMVGYNNSYIGFTVDINGIQPPNRAGHDLFVFGVENENDVIDGRKMYRKYSEDMLENFPVQEQAGLAGFPCSKDSKQNANGIGCAWYALRDVCPDDETKGYWECLPD